MELYIGGYAQGKLQYVSDKYGIPAERISDGAVEDYRRMEGKVIYDHFHLWVRRLLEQGVDVEAALEELLAAQPDALIISDEIGGGIVPMDAFEREYRERQDGCSAQLRRVPTGWRELYVESDNRSNKPDPGPAWRHGRKCEKMLYRTHR